VSYHQCGLNLDMHQKTSACHSGLSLLYCAKFHRPLRGKWEIFQTGEDDGSESCIFFRRKAGFLRSLNYESTRMNMSYRRKSVVKLFRREGGEDFFKAWFAAQRIPKRQQF
jgi:hypothetical protein